MQKFWAGACVIGFVLAGWAFAADDTALAAATRTKKLQTKVTLDHNQAMLKEIFEDIKGQLEDAKVGSISFKYDQGVSMNQRLSITAKDKPLHEVLDELLKKNDLGYVVISKDKDRYDGWLLIKQGKERGYPAGQEPKAKAKGK